MDADAEAGEERERFSEACCLGRPLDAGMADQEPAPTSNSTRSAPAATAASRTRACSRARASAAPRWPITSGRPSVRPAGSRLCATTTAQSSASSPPANARQSARTAAASACAGELGPLGQARVEPLDAVELAAGARLDHAVGVENDGRARGQLGLDLLVRLPLVDAEREPAAVEWLDRPVRVHQTRQRMSRARALAPARGSRARDRPS